MTNLALNVSSVNGVLPKDTPHTNGFDHSTVNLKTAEQLQAERTANNAHQEKTLTVPEWIMPPLPESARLDPSLGRNACTWLDRYIEYSHKWSPRGHDDAHESIGLWLLSTVAARRVRLDLGGDKYPNFYILQSIQTSIRAKTTTAKLATELLTMAGLDHLLLPDENTPQSMVKIMSTSIPDNWSTLDEEAKSRLTRRWAFAGQRGWFYDEFGGKVAGMMNDKSINTEFRNLFRKFDDNAPSYSTNTISRSEEVVKLPYLALLGNTTPADLQQYAKKGGALWNDGFWARFVLLAVEPGAKPSKARFPDERKTIPNELIIKLRQWHDRLGIPDVEVSEATDKGGSRYTLKIGPLPITDCFLGDGVFDAYYRYADALTDIITETGTTDLYGNYSRLPEKALRAAMLFASLENNNRIEMAQWARAQEIAERWRQSLHNLYAELANEKQSRKSATEQKIRESLISKGAQTAREIIKNIRGLDTETGNKLLDNMVKAGELVSTTQGKTHIFAIAP